ncbi:hypothetical protein MJT46_001362 [Ovis ammon polii x Ovis aries]|nr:hypothetical protein MJT46_001362 [Ovis ammon polii x Ovis aries]
MSGSSRSHHELLLGPVFSSGSSPILFFLEISMENGRPPDPADWAVMDVVNYFRMAGFEEQASAFQEQLNNSLLKLNLNNIMKG